MTRIINFRNIMILSMLVCFAMAALYIVNLQQAVSITAQKRVLESTFVAYETEIAELEEAYAIKVGGITSNSVKALGYIEPERIFVADDSILTYNQ